MTSRGRWIRLAQRFARRGGLYLCRLRLGPRMAAQQVVLDTALARRWTRLPVLPLLLDVEPNNYCNYRCAHCQVTHWDHARTNLDIAGLNRILDQFPRVAEVTLQGMGEPLLNRRTPALLRRLAERGIRVDLTTNGSVMTDEVRDALLQTRTRVTFSLDGATPEVFETIRVRSSFDRVSTNVRRLTEARSSRNAGRRPRIDARMVVTTRNVHELPDVVRLAAQLGLDAVVAHTVLVDWGRRDMEDVNLGTRVRGHPGLSGRVAEAERVAAQVGIGFSLSGELYDRDQVCRWPWTRPFISAAGDVMPCCVLSDPARFAVGNLHRQNIRDIWNNAAYRQLRSRLASGRIPAACTACYATAERDQASSRRPPSVAETAGMPLTPSAHGHARADLTPWGRG